MALFDFLKKLRKKETNSPAKPIEESSETREIAKEKTTASMFSINETGMFVLQSPHMTERARMQAERGQYTFRIDPDASKTQVQRAVEKLYNVHVRHVSIIRAHEKPRRRGFTEGVKKGYKKAVVALRDGEAIDIF